MDTHSQQSGLLQCKNAPITLEKRSYGRMARPASTSMNSVLHAQRRLMVLGDSAKTATMTEGSDANLASACVDHHRWPFDSGHCIHLTPAPGSNRGPPICLKLWDLARTARGEGQAGDWHSLSFVYGNIVGLAVFTDGLTVHRSYLLLYSRRLNLLQPSQAERGLDRPQNLPDLTRCDLCLQEV